ncbi:alpha/beta fold hydrolase [Thalassobacillus sp. CUG 92003]|uniref:alpha/beta fold hydrolase n=1 Tax=Thalassobacillus sp. CUG 92003 TaxID=2736641 RepID=UPI0015E64993|nr:alpha/beta hydrolase [Thalassobacillus sp. CUG 92003]
MGFFIPVEQNVRVYVEDLNPGDGLPIVFIHGWPVNHNMFEYQFNQLPKLGYRCIGIDLRGCGQSDRPWYGYSYDRISDDISMVMESLGVENVILVGHSMGGAVAIRYMARHHGNRVKKLVLIGAAAPVFTRRPGFKYGMTREDIDTIIENTYTNRPKMLEGFGDIFFSRYVTEGVRNWFNTLGLAASGHATAMYAQSLRDEDLRSDLPAINVPTGIFHGVLDKVCPFPLAEVMHAGIQGSELIPFLSGGHGLFYTELEQFNHELVRFLAQ